MTCRLVRYLLAAFLLLPLAGCGPRANKLLIGKWKPAEEGGNYTIEFTSDGNVRLGGDRLAPLGKMFRFAKLLGDFDIKPGKSVDITYKALNDHELEIQADYTALLEKLSQGGRSTKPPRDLAKDIKPRDKVTYAVSADELTLTNDEGESLKLRRVQ
jgi:hypothetical protein